MIDIVTTSTCDGCGFKKEMDGAECDLPDSWGELELDSKESGYSVTDRWDLCPDCVGRVRILLDKEVKDATIRTS